MKTHRALAFTAALAGFLALSPLRAADTEIRDGTSNTIVVGENPPHHVPDRGTTVVLLAASLAALAALTLMRRRRVKAA